MSEAARTKKKKRRVGEFLKLMNQLLSSQDAAICCFLHQAQQPSAITEVLSALALGTTCPQSAPLDAIHLRSSQRATLVQGLMAALKHI